jgi:hypothetical protein
MFHVYYVGLVSFLCLSSVSINIIKVIVTFLFNLATSSLFRTTFKTRPEVVLTIRQRITVIALWLSTVQSVSVYEWPWYQQCQM